MESQIIKAVLKIKKYCANKDCSNCSLYDLLAQDCKLNDTPENWDTELQDLSGLSLLEKNGYAKIYDTLMEKFREIEKETITKI